MTKYFGALKRPERQLDATYTEEPAQDGERSVVLRRVGTVGVVGAEYHIPAGAHADFPAIEVLSDLLDGQPAGRLYKGLVLTKKATKVSADTYGWHDPGLLEILVQVQNGQALEAVRDTMTGIIEKLQDEKITDEDVNRAKAKFAAIQERLMSNSGRIAITLSDWAAKGDWRLFFLHRDRVAAVTPADVSRVAKAYLQRSNRTVGLYIPSEATQRVSIPETPDVAALVKDYKGGATVAKGELFEPTVANILGRVKQQKLASGVQAALLPKKTRGEVVIGQLTLHYGNADSLQGNMSATQFLGSIMERGTTKHTRQQLEDELDRLKARLSASGSMGELTIGIQAKRENLPQVLSLLHEILRSPTFPADEFDVLKRESKEALDKSRTDPQALAVRAMRRKAQPSARTTFAMCRPSRNRSSGWTPSRAWIRSRRSTRSNFRRRERRIGPRRRFRSRLHRESSRGKAIGMEGEDGGQPRRTPGSDDSQGRECGHRDPGQGERDLLRRPHAATDQRGRR